VKINKQGSHAPLLHCLVGLSKKPHGFLLAQATPRNMIRDMKDKKRYVKVWAALRNVSSNMAHHQYLSLVSLKTGFPTLT
jgi:acyl-CoA-binding protein